MVTDRGDSRGQAWFLVYNPEGYHFEDHRAERDDYLLEDHHVERDDYLLEDHHAERDDYLLEDHHAERDDYLFEPGIRVTSIPNRGVAKAPVRLRDDGA
ncbi:MAG: hypothetical protein ACLQIB_37770 [Isosphaeraceae bacterium]